MTIQGKFHSNYEVIQFFIILVSTLSNIKLESIEGFFHLRIFRV